MSTGKRLAKRSIIGTRVCAPGEDGKYYSGVIHAVKTPASFPENNNCINLTPNTRYSVRFDPRQGNLGRTTAEFLEIDLIGPGFRSVAGITLVQDQKCFVTFNGREVQGRVLKHHVENDEVIIQICPPGVEVSRYLHLALCTAVLRGMWYKNPARNRFFHANWVYRLNCVLGAHFFVSGVKFALSLLLAAKNYVEYDVLIEEL